MTTTTTHQIPGLTDDTGLDTRIPPLDLGRQIVTIESIRYHQSTMAGPDGIMVEVTAKDGTTRAFRINLGGKFPKYGAIDAKRLFTAARGLRFDDPAAAALGAAEVCTMYAPANPMRGRGLEVECTETEKVNPKSGRPYRNVRVLGPADAGAAPALSAPAAPPPPPAPSAPAAPVGPPAGWYAFPAADPRYLTHYYDASGATRLI